MRWYISYCRFALWFGLFLRRGFTVFRLLFLYFREWHRQFEPSKEMILHTMKGVNSMNFYSALRLICTFLRLFQSYKRHRKNFQKIVASLVYPRSSLIKPCRTYHHTCSNGTEYAYIAAIECNHSSILITPWEHSRQPQIGTLIIPIQNGFTFGLHQSLSNIER